MKNAQFTTFTLSALPPSANNLFATGMHGRFKTIKYKRIVLEWGAVNGVHAMIVAAKEVVR